MALCISLVTDDELEMLADCTQPAKVAAMRGRSIQILLIHVFISTVWRRI
jgi:hypothetical protein